MIEALRKFWGWLRCKPVYFPRNFLDCDLEDTAWVWYPKRYKIKNPSGEIGCMWGIRWYHEIEERS